ncbi:MAG TPA: DUF349 domain-containing protein [Cyclobacteriaceae bacterium]
MNNERELREDLENSLSSVVNEKDHENNDDNPGIQEAKQKSVEAFEAQEQKKDNPENENSEDVENINVHQNQDTSSNYDEEVVAGQAVEKETSDPNEGEDTTDHDETSDQHAGEDTSAHDETSDSNEGEDTSAHDETSDSNEAEDTSDHDDGDNTSQSSDESNNSPVDYSEMGKEELLEELKQFLKIEDYRGVNHKLKQIKDAFDRLADTEKADAYNKYIKDGGEKDGFEYKEDSINAEFNSRYNIVKDNITQFFDKQEKQKEDNLSKKNDILERLRAIVDGEESNASINALKELQAEWRSIGPVPRQFNKGLWASYNALIDRFYDRRSIYFELKELDRKKNLKSKIDLCEKAEELGKIENLQDAIKQLNELHEEFKHIGPVPKDDQEDVWKRFKAASDNVYARRKAFVENLKNELHQNMEKKLNITEHVQEFLAFDSERINDWNQKTKEILNIQKEWEAIGGLPRDKAKEINRKFWTAFKGFFHNKSKFFKKLEKFREENLLKKQELIQKAEEVKDSEDWNNTADYLKSLQANWKAIGPVPEKQRDEIYKQFKAACDHFFEKKRMQNKEAEREFEDNLKQKEQICEQIDNITQSDDPVDLDILYGLIDKFSEIGFVPRRSIKDIQKKFNNALGNLIDNCTSLSEEKKEELQINIEVNKIKGSPHGNKKLERKENSIRKKISTLENDISTWKNNLEFFANSTKADELKREFKEKIEQAQSDLHNLRKQLKALNSTY